LDFPGDHNLPPRFLDPLTSANPPHRVSAVYAKIADPASVVEKDFFNVERTRAQRVLASWGQGSSILTWEIITDISHSISVPFRMQRCNTARDAEDDDSSRHLFGISFGIEAESRVID